MFIIFTAARNRVVAATNTPMRYSKIVQYSEKRRLFIYTIAYYRATMTSDPKRMGISSFEFVTFLPLLLAWLQHQ